MEESFGPVSSQNFDFAVPFNSTSLLDGTMPDLLDSTIPNSQKNGMFCKVKSIDYNFIPNTQI